MKDSRTKRSPPEPCLPSPQHKLPHGSEPSVQQWVSPCSLACSHLREISGVCEGAHAAGCVSVR
eukprot:2929350-Pyramimonas_sp.AAC.1